MRLIFALVLFIKVTLFKNQSLTKGNLKNNCIDTVIYFQFDESHLTEITAEVREVLGMEKWFVPHMVFTFCQKLSAHTRGRVLYIIKYF